MDIKDISGFYSKEQAMATLHALDGVAVERIAQQEKWGEQNHPDGTGPDVEPLRFLSSFEEIAYEPAKDLARWATDYTDDAFSGEDGTWRHIFLEEVFEALAESDPIKLRAELIQSAAVAVAWVEAIDRRMSNA